MTKIFEILILVFIAFITNSCSPKVSSNCSAEDRNFYKENKKRLILTIDSIYQSSNQTFKKILSVNCSDSLFQVKAVSKSNIYKTITLDRQFRITLIRNELPMLY